MKSDPEAIRLAILNIRQAMQRGDRQSARRLARLVAVLEPDSEEPWLYLAAIASPRASIYYLGQALKNNPDSLRALKGMEWAEARLKRDQPEKTSQETTPSILNPSGKAEVEEDQEVFPEKSISSESISQPSLDKVPAQEFAPSIPTKKRLAGSVARHRWLTGFRRYSSHWQNWIGLILVSVFVMIALTAPWISPANPKTPGPFIKVAGFRIGDTTPHSPAAGYPLGTLPGELDVLHALIWGTRDALSFGLEVALLAAAFGMLYGAISGYAGGVVSSLMMRITNSFLAFPIFAGVVFLNQLYSSALVAAGGFFDNYHNIWFLSGGGIEYPIQKLMQLVDPLILVLILFSWMPYARITNTVVASLKRMEFIEAARMIGARSSRIILRHLLPNSIAPSLVMAARDVGSMVILQATFTFIGLGGSSTWGTMLVLGRDWILGPKGGVFTYWWVYIPATLMLALFGIGWNLFGDGISEVLDPRDQ